VKPYIKRTIVEDGRTSGGHSYKHFRRTARQQTRARDEDEEYPYDASERMREYNWGERKEFADDLRVLERYLESQVGCPWNKVWSDICRVNDGRNLKGRHLREHTEQMVHTYAEHLVNMERAYSRGWGFHVDKHGLLRHTPYTKWDTRARNRKPAPITKIASQDPHAWYEKVKGVWHHIIGIGPFSIRVRSYPNNKGNIETHIETHYRTRILRKLTHSERAGIHQRNDGPTKKAK
jgi:hypothetical protein